MNRNGLVVLTALGVGAFAAGQNAPPPMNQPITSTSNYPSNPANPQVGPPGPPAAARPPLYGNPAEVAAELGWRRAFGAGPSGSLARTHAHQSPRLGPAYFATLQHSSLADGSYWELGVGGGASLASILTHRGDLVGAQVAQGEWIDRVFQYVGVSHNQTNPPYFIHQAGTYAKDGLRRPFYAPVLAPHYAPRENALYTYSWPQQAHIPTPYKSGLLLQQRLTDLGDGVVEVVQFGYNFAADTLDFHNLPWGGVSKVTLPKKVYGSVAPNSRGGWKHFEPQFDKWEAKKLRTETSGWIGFIDPNFRNPHHGGAHQQHGLGLVTGTGVAAGASDPQADFVVRVPTMPKEDLHVIEAIRFNAVPRGKGFYLRYYLVLNRLEKIHGYCNELAPHAVFGLIGPPSRVTPLGVAQSGPGFALGGGNPLLYTMAEYSDGAQPLFVVEHRPTGSIGLSADPYAFSPKPYDGTTAVRDFLGWIPKAATLQALGQPGVAAESVRAALQPRLLLTAQGNLGVNWGEYAFPAPAGFARAVPR